MREENVLARKWKRFYGWAKGLPAVLIGLAFPLFVMLFCGASAIFTPIYALAGLSDATIGNAVSVTAATFTVAVMSAICLWAISCKDDIFVA